jgi:hypothetical protein
MGKDSKKEDKAAKPELSYDERIKLVNEIAKPLADEKLCKKVCACVRAVGGWGQRGQGLCQLCAQCTPHSPAQCATPTGHHSVSRCTAATLLVSPTTQVLKLSKKAAKRKQLKRGVKEVVKAIRKNTKG